MTNENGKVRHELITWLQYFLISFIASSVAFRMLEASRYGSSTEGVNDPNASINLNIREMILDMWQDYYQWWLSIFVGLCILRFLILFVSNRVSNRYKLK